MQIVIDINDGIYKEILNGKDGWSNYVHGLIRTGTPLPKGHGDLIDRNSILCDDSPCNLCGHTDECFKLLASTIIKADKAEKQG